MFCIYLFNYKYLNTCIQLNEFALFLFQDVPEYWIPASGVPIEDGLPQPDENGHIPGTVY